MPTRYSALSGVACATGSCLAVGEELVRGNYAPLIERAVGGHWSAVPETAISSAPGSELSDVSCPATAPCVAVGETVTDTQTAETVGTSEPLTLERGTAGHWSTAPSPHFPSAELPEFNGVTCLADHRCLVAGDLSEGSDPLHLRSVTFLGVSR